ncbi:MAG TPA: divalent-cation tolerance protein CutA [Thermoplasmata archaeon]|nr:divalent-cation tolerance protein CutA [Thermoplasmata archaeon]HYB78273.1 divalent-cation tolerance protein CutA [Thermoplasmata archaeon]
MSPYPLDPIRAVGPARLVITTYPSREAALQSVGPVLDRRLAACANFLPATSRYWWKGRVETAEEVVVLFKTVPKRVGALCSFLRDHHPYDVPEILEVDVPRVDAGYLTYLAETLDPASPPPPLGGGTTRRAGPRGPGARGPGRTRAPPRRRSR